MGQRFTNNENADILKLKDEIAFLKQNIKILENQIQTVQANCKHVFLEVEGYRKCSKCLKVEVSYY